MSASQNLASQIATILESAGLPATIRSIKACVPGGNNRTYRVTTPNGVFAAKQYFRHIGDTRARLASEFAFLVYAKKVAPGFVPEPIAMDEDSSIAIYEYIEGRPFKSGDIGIDEVQQAGQFFLALNQPNSRVDGCTLPIASEACFSIKDHIHLIDRKLARLNDISPVDAEDRYAVAFIAKLTAKWKELAAGISAEAVALRLDPLRVLEAGERCISPSDFGFHNALRDAKGNIRFLDFEYAGWDDPAKMIGDFFAQIAVPVPQEMFELFLERCAERFSHPTELIERARLLRSASLVKWCCIVLNVFFPVNIERRHFANPDLDATALKRKQCAKALSIFHFLETRSHGLY